VLRLWVKQIATNSEWGMRALVDQRKTTDLYTSSSTNRYSHHGPVINPYPFHRYSKEAWRLRERRSAGGSSGGSAAAVAMGLCDMSVGFPLRPQCSLTELGIARWELTLEGQYVYRRHIVESLD
jgi:hypothetical protein